MFEFWTGCPNLGHSDRIPSIKALDVGEHTLPVRLLESKNKKKGTTGWPVIHGRVFLVLCTKWLVQCTLLYKCTLENQGTRNTRPCLSVPVVEDVSEAQKKVLFLVARPLRPLAAPPPSRHSGHRYFFPYIEKKVLFSFVAHPFSPPPLLGARPLREELCFAASLTKSTFLTSYH